MSSIYTAQTGLPDHAPQWLKSAAISNYEIAINSDGTVIWYGGTWYVGTWYGGTWRGGTWYVGTWHDGEWYGGTWYGGAWHDGEWYGGTWYGGAWHGGTWHDGTSTMRSKYQPTIKDNEISVGCETMTADEWEQWLASNEEFSTPRNTPEFVLIEAHIRAAIAYLRTISKLNF